ncbi:hypothetical protein D516_0240 [Rhodobacter sp. AKP1]|nr:hypothetical protein D516_0240 [Rhodobacter sp. AKP1]
MHRSPPCRSRCPSRNPWRKTRRPCRSCRSSRSRRCRRHPTPPPCRSRLWTSRSFPPCP